MMFIELAVKSSLILGAALVAVALMGRRTAATRHVVLASALVATLSLPALAVVGPHWRVSSPIPFTKTSEQPVSRSIEVPEPVAHNAGSGLRVIQDRNRSSNFAPRWGTGASLALLTFVWLIGVAIAAVRLMAGIASATRLARDAAPLTNSDWNDSLASISDSLRLACEVALRTSDRAAVPLAWRLGRTCTLILPTAAKGWEADTRRAVLLHECGHLDRHDCVVRSLATLACGFWWFNPLAHFALRRLRGEQERACDDLVLAAGVAPVDYARQLFEIANRSVVANAEPTPIVAMVRRSELEDRMFAIVDRSRRRGTLSRRTRLIATVIVGVVVAVVGALRLSAARAQSGTMGVALLQGTGPGGPQFALMREVEEDTRVRVARALEAVSQDNDESVRAVAERALQTIRALPPGTVVVSRSCRGNCRPGSGGFASLACAVLFEAQSKMALWELESGVAGVRRAAVTKLRRESETGADALAELLRDSDPQVRSLAAIELDSVTFPPAVPGWIDLLLDKDDSLRERAAISLGVIGDPAAVDALTSVLLNDSNSDVRRQAARSLGLIAGGS